MASLLSLPQELQDAIEIYLDDEDCIQLCQTCRKMMSAVQHRAYRRLVMEENKERRGRNVLAIAAGPRARLVRTVQYSPNDPQPLKGWEDLQPPQKCQNDPNIKLSDKVREALSSLHKFPNLEEVALVFDEWFLVAWPMTPFALADFDDHYGAHDAEPWRILLEQSFLALSQSAGAFKRLRIDGLPPAPEYHAFDAPEWKSLLNNLTFFEIKLHSIEDMGAGSMTIAHEMFVSCMPDSFFRHLTNCEHVRVIGDENAVMGHYDNYEPIQWTEVQLPNLKVFELEYACFSIELARFLAAHCKTLEKISLRNCFANQVTDWSDIIHEVRAARPTRLCEFEIVAYPVDLGDLVKERKFVVAETCESYGSIQPVEWNVGEDDPDPDPNLDESEVVEQWKGIEKLLEQNRSRQME